MLRTMFKSKIHRATVTQADLHYVGSVTVDADLMDAADLLPGELVHIVDITNGARLETYVIEGERGSGVIGINGAAAHLVHPGDLVILISYAQVDDAEARALRPAVVHVDAANRIAALGDRHRRARPRHRRRTPPARGRPRLNRQAAALFRRPPPPPSPERGRTRCVSRTRTPRAAAVHWARSRASSVSSSAVHGRSPWACTYARRSAFA